MYAPVGVGTGSEEHPSIHCVVLDAIGIVLYQFVSHGLTGMMLQMIVGYTICLNAAFLFLKSDCQGMNWSVLACVPSPSVLSLTE